MGLDLDLATVAGMAGLGGSAVAAAGAFIFFKGLIMRILAQVIVTAGLSFVGFIALFNMLGFKIVPPTEIAGVPIPGAENFSVQSAPAEQPKGAYIQSPWSK
jgi:hypothetical protein